MTEPKIEVDQILARYRQNAEGYHVYDANDGLGFCLRNPRGFALSTYEVQIWAIGALDCLNDIPKAVALAHGYRDCYVNEAARSGSLVISRDCFEAQVALAEQALTKIQQRGCTNYATTGNVFNEQGTIAQGALDALNDGTKSQKDWAALKPRPLKRPKQNKQST
jgi:hypothetical protein